jgi:CYTH domain-containing protein
MTKEIERKYVLKYIPDYMKANGSAYIKQGYLFEDPSRYSVRLRNISDIYYTVTVKSGSGLSREEHENFLSKEVFEALWERTYCSLEKRRYFYSDPEKDLLYEIDEYLGDLEGLFTLEVEFQEVGEATFFLLPKDLQDIATDVTGYHMYSNKYLAAYGITVKSKGDLNEI